MLVEHWKPHYGHRELGKTIEHIDDHGEQERADVESTVFFITSVHPGPYEHRRSDDRHEDDLDSLEDVDERILLDKQPLLVEAGLEEIHFGDQVLGEDEGGSVAEALVEWDGELVVQPHSHMEVLELLHELTH